MKQAAKPAVARPRTGSLVLKVVAAVLLLLAVGWGGVRWLALRPSSVARSDARSPASAAASASEVPRVTRLEALDPAVAAAIRDAVAAVERAPADGARWGELGIVYNAHRYYALADRCYARAAELDAGAAEWPHLRGVLAEERGDAAAAVEHYRAALERAPANRAARYRLGGVLLQTGSVGDAAHAFEALERSAPEEPWGSLGLGRVALRRGDNAEAARRFERALEVAPDHQQAAYLLASAYRVLGKTAEARRLAEQTRDGVRPSSPPDPIVERVRGALRSLQSRVDTANRLLAAGNADAAAAIYSSVLEVDPRHYDALYNLALLHGRQQRFGEAQQLLERAIAVRPESTQARLLLALALASQDRVEAAGDTLRELLELDPEHVEARRMLDQLGP
jgi:tetratricopeptide (TPR) repeat protein